MSTQDEIRALRDELELRALRAERRLLETVDQAIGNPLDARRDEDGRLWRLLTARGAAQPGSAVAETLTDLELMRQEGRILARSNPFAKRALKAKVQYIAGGWTARVQRKPGVPIEAVPREVLALAQRALEGFRRERDVDARERELVRRGHRDGEAFLELTAEPSAHLHLRWVEPSEVVPPATTTGEDDRDSWGIRTAVGDVERVEGFWIRRGARLEPELVAAARVVHAKLNVDGNVKRGESSFFPVAEDLRLANRMKINGATITTIWASIAYVRKLRTATREAAQSFVAGQADLVRTNPATGRTEQVQDWTGKPRILTAPDSVDYEFPTSGLDLSNVELMIQLVLRGVASGWDMPEWMLTAKNDSVNFASALVTEGPTGMAVREEQGGWRPVFERINQAGLEWAVLQALVPGLSPAVLPLVEVVCVPSSVEVRDRARDVGADSTLRRDGVLSPQTMAQRAGLDYEDEQRGIEEHLDRMGGTDPVLGGLGGDVGPGLPGPR